MSPLRGILALGLCLGGRGVWASPLPAALEQRRPWLSGERDIRVLLAEQVQRVDLGEGGSWEPTAGEVLWGAKGDAPLALQCQTRWGPTRLWRVRGRVRLLPTKRGGLVINEVPLEAYLAGVLANEMPSGFPLAALQAQAVASRTLALRQLGGKGEHPFDVRAHLQVYTGVDGEREAVWRALSTTAGQVLLREGELVDATFHASCGGRTASGEEAWEGGARGEGVWDGEPASLADEEGIRAFLARKEGSYCSAYPYFRWQREWTWEEWTKQWRRTFPTLPGGASWTKVQGVRVLRRGPSGRVLLLEMETDAGPLQVEGFRLRWLLAPPLPSTLFVVETDSEGVRMLGGGYGHGVGLCQYGAGGMARAGYDYIRILQHYYPGAEVWDLTGRWDGRKAEEEGRPSPAPSQASPPRPPTRWHLRRSSER